MVAHSEVLNKNTVDNAKIPRGKPVSGRSWKKVQRTRFSAVKTKARKEFNSTWDEKLAVRSKLASLKELQQEIKDRRQKEKEGRIEAKAERERRRKENELKSAQVQVITKTHKLKGMSKKQLRQIKKTRMNKNGVIEYVGLYEK